MGFLFVFRAQGADGVGGGAGKDFGVDVQSGGASVVVRFDNEADAGRPAPVGAVGRIHPMESDLLDLVGSDVLRSREKTAIDHFRGCEFDAESSQPRQGKGCEAECDDQKHQRGGGRMAGVVHLGREQQTRQAGNAADENPRRKVGVIAFGHGSVKLPGESRYRVYTGCKSAVNLLYAPCKPVILASE